MLFFGRETDHCVLYRNNPVLSTTVHAAVLQVTGCFYLWTLCSDCFDAVSFSVTEFCSLMHVKNTTAEKVGGAEAISKGKLTVAHLEQTGGVIAKR